MSDQTLNNDNIIELDFYEEMKTSYRDYAMSVIISRALPDVRDGLKPVQRRILYAMNELSLAPDKPHRKSARIVGDTMGKYHPHGDSSIYEALVHMSEDYSLNLPLVDGHGNFGSIDGDGAAAMRYTEARLSKAAMLLLNNLDKGLVNFIPNFDNSEQEPVVLPALIPNLLINGTTGIAVGMATNIPPHNPAQIISGVMAYIDKPSITTEELMEHIPGPDFPTGGIITNGSALKDIYETGEGKIRIRAKTEIENSDYGRKNIIITEIPYTVAGSKTKLVEALSTLMKEKVFEEIYDVRDESSKEGIRIVIEVRKDRDPENLLNGLFKKTAMEDTYSVNLLAVNRQQPIVFSLKSMIKEFVDFQIEIYTKEYKYLLDKATKRLEIVEGLIRACDVIDLIIEILRGSDSVKQAKQCLVEGVTEGIRFKNEDSEPMAATLHFTSNQADAILAMPLSRLVGLEILKLMDENKDLLDKIFEYKGILSDNKQLLRQIKTRLREYRRQLNSPRKTLICDEVAKDYVVEEKIEDIHVLIDKFGYIKSLDDAAFSRTLPETLSEFSYIITLKNTDKLCIFTAQGNMFTLKAAAIPKGRPKDKGTLIHSLCKINDDDIIFYCSFESLFESQVVFITKNGYIKQVSGIEFDTTRSQIASTKLEDGDLLVTVCPLSASSVLSGNMKVIILTHKGLSLAYPLSEVSELKKTGRGVKGITLADKDTVAFGTVLESSADSFVFNQKTYSAKKIRMRKRADKGQKANILL